MPIKSRTIGTGITKETITEFLEPLTLEEKSEWRKLERKLSREETPEGLYLKPLEAWARKVLEDAALATPEDSLRTLLKLPVKNREWTSRAPKNDHPGVERDSSEGYAIRLVSLVHRIRHSLERNRRGDPEEATLLGIELGKLGQEAVMKFNYENSSLRGLEFIEGPRGPRQDALGSVMEEAFTELLRAFGEAPKWKELLKQLPAGEGQIIQEIAWDDFYEADGGGRIYWHSKGREKETTFKAFRERLTTIRKKNLS